MSEYKIDWRYINDPDAPDIDLSIDNLTSSLAEKASQGEMDTIGINVLYPPTGSGITPAKGDGVTDDTNAIQSAINYAVANNQKYVWLPEGTYKVTSTLEINNFIIFKGSGVKNTIISFNNTTVDGSGNATQSLFRIEFATATTLHYNFYHLMFQDFSAVSASTVAKNQHCFVFNSVLVNYQVMRQLRCEGFTGSFMHFIHDGSRTQKTVYFHNPIWEHILLYNTSAFLTQELINSPGSIWIYGAKLEDIHLEASCSFNSEYALFDMQGFYNTNYKDIICEGALQTSPQNIFRVQTTCDFSKIYFEYHTVYPQVYIRVENGRCTLSKIFGIPNNNTFIYIGSPAKAVITDCDINSIKKITTTDTTGKLILQRIFSGSYITGNLLDDVAVPLYQNNLLEVQDNRTSSNFNSEFENNLEIFSLDRGCPFDSTYKKGWVTVSSPGSSSFPIITADSDATYGRIINVTPSGTDKAVYLTFTITVPSQYVGAMYSLSVRYKMAATTMVTLSKALYTNGAPTTAFFNPTDTVTTMPNGNWVDMYQAGTLGTTINIRWDVSGSHDYTSATQHVLSLSDLRINVGKKILPLRTSFNEPIEFSASALPTAGTYLLGDKIRNSAPTPSGYVGWVCTTAGSPGTWKGYGTIQA